MVGAKLIILTPSIGSVECGSGAVPVRCSAQSYVTRSLDALSDCRGP